MKIVLCGYFNIGSAGDEAALKFILGQFPDADITVMTRNPSSEYADRNRVHVHEKLEHMTKEAAAGRNLYGFNPRDDPARIHEILALLERADLLLLGPGSWINEHNTDMFRGNLQEMYAMSMLARMVRCPYGIWSSSASRLRHKHLIGQAQALIDGARFVIFRDCLSAGTLVDSGVMVSGGKIHALPDAVLGFHKSWNGPAPYDKGRMVISAKDMGRGKRFDYRNGLSVIACDWLQRDKENIVDFVAQYTGHSPNDFEESLAIAGPTPRIRVLAAQTPEETLKLYAGAARVVATRLHAMVFAAMAGVSEIAAVEYDPKQNGFLDWFGNCGNINDPELLSPTSLKWNRIDVAPLLPMLDQYRKIITEAVGG